MAPSLVDGAAEGQTDLDPPRVLDPWSSPCQTDVSMAILKDTPWYRPMPGAAEGPPSGALGRLASRPSSPYTKADSPCPQGRLSGSEARRGPLVTETPLPGSCNAQVRDDGADASEILRDG